MPLFPAADRLRIQQYIVALVLDGSCTIARNVATDDSTGGPSPPSWQPVAPGTPVSCALRQKIGRYDEKELAVAGQLAGVEIAELIVPLGTDVTRNDRVTIGGEIFQVIGTTAARTDAVTLHAFVQAVGATP